MFNGLVLTDKGKELLVKQLNGYTITFTAIKMGDGQRPDNIASMTDLVNVKQVLPIARFTTVDNSTALMGANLLGENVTEPFYWREIGVFAKDDDEDVEYLFSYDNAGEDASYIPAGGAVAEHLIDLNVSVGNTENTTIYINKSLVYATEQGLQDAIYNLQTTLTTKINSDVKSVNDALIRHINDKENPHGVTKSDVGLGLVVNQGVATEINAKGGTANDVYMTPLRTKNAIDALGVASDGNVIIKIGNSQPAVQSGKTIIWINTSS